MARKRVGSITWHFCRNCSGWPTEGYTEGTGASGDKCHECLVKQTEGTCEAG